MFFHVVNSWAHLFSKAPVLLEITGLWTQEIDEGMESDRTFIHFECMTTVRHQKNGTISSFLQPCLILLDKELD